jgi:putative endonuclease
MASESATIGYAGEAIVVAYLEELGWQILEKNYHCRYGEIDIIARTGDEGLVFIEVKTYKRHGMTSGRDAMSLAKQKRIVHAIQHFMGYQTLSFDPLFMRVDLVLATPAVVLEHLSNVIDGALCFS